MFAVAFTDGQPQRATTNYWEKEGVWGGGLFLFTICRHISCSFCSIRGSSDYSQVWAPPIFLPPPSHPPPLTSTTRRCIASAALFKIAGSADPPAFPGNGYLEEGWCVCGSVPTPTPPTPFPLTHAVGNRRCRVRCKQHYNVLSFLLTFVSRLCFHHTHTHTHTHTLRLGFGVGTQPQTTIFNTFLDGEVWAPWPFFPPLLLFYPVTLVLHFLLFVFPSRRLSDGVFPVSLAFAGCPWRVYGRAHCFFFCFFFAESQSIIFDHFPLFTT